MNAKITTTGKIRQKLRVLAGYSPRETHPVIDIVSGSTEPPIRSGRRGYWTTPSGRTVVHNPAVYGWRTLYHKSTCSVRVGYLWLLRNIASL